MVRTIVLATLMFAAGCENDTSIPNHLDLSASIDALMSRLHTEGRFNGAVVIARHDGIVYERGWGVANAEAGLAFSPDTPVDGASLAKTLVAASVWMLVDEKRLQLDAPVQAYLPEFPHAGTRVRDLLEHSAGLAEFEETDGRSNSELVAALDPTPAFEPGTRFSYCNECFDTLALLIERVTAMPWIEFLRERVLEPQQMDSVFLRPARLADWDGFRTVSYRTVGDSLVPFDVWDNEAFYGSSNLYFSARDLSHWAAAWIRGEVVPPSVRSAALGIPAFTNGEVSALNRANWYYDEADGPYYFNGHLRGFHHTVYWDPESGLSIVWVTNVLEPRPNPQLLTRALIRIVQGGPPADGELRWFNAAGVAGDSTAYQGTYEVLGLGTLTVTPDDIGASFRIDNGAEHDGYPSETFYLPDFDVEVGFSELQDGHFQQVHWLSIFDSLTGTRASS